MHCIGEIPLFDAADYLDTSTDCADVLLDLIRHGREDDLRRGLGAVARATGRPVGELPQEIVDHVLRADLAWAATARAMMDRLGVRAGGHPVSSA